MTNTEFDNLFNKLDAYVKENVNTDRYLHTQGVVIAAEKYAKKYGADIQKAKIAAVFHDACKGKAKLEHGELAAKLLKEKFGIDDEDILNAIANHTIGRKNPSLLEKVIKLADLLEDGRDYDDAPRIRAYDDKVNNIDKTYLLLLERQREVLIAKGIDYDKRTDELIDWMKGYIAENMNNKDIALFIATELDERKALDITILDIAEKSGFADYFVIASAKSVRQLQALSTNVEDKLAEQGILAHHIEGKGDCGWILMDYGDIIVNLFTIEQRDHYNIEKIWNDCVKLDFESKNE